MNQISNIAALSGLKKVKVLFVGSFVTKAKDSSTGGQTFASVSLTNSALSQKIEWIKLDTTSTTSQKRIFLFRAISGIIRLIKFITKIIILRPEYILLFAAHGWSFKEKGWMARIGKAFKKKIIFAPRSGIIENDITKNPKFETIITQALENTDYLICQSNAWRKFYNTYKNNSSYTPVVVNNWLDFNNYSNIPIKERQPKRLLFLGRVTENKGVFDLLEAFAPICEVYQLKLSIAGQGESYERFKSEIKRKGLEERIELLGWIHGSDKQAQLKNADLLLLPSYKEGYPNALLEAMASGIPTIATNVGSIPEIVEHKNNGYLIEPGNIKELQQALIWYIEHPEKRMAIAKKARSKIKEQNTIDNAVAKFEQIILS